MTGEPSRAGPIAALPLAAYEALGHVAGPVLSLVHRRRSRVGKEDPARRGERFGRASVPRPPGPLIWIHAASVGESNAALALISDLVGRGFPILHTSGTVTSAAVAAERLPEGAIHQYAPFDTPPCLARFLDHWRPRLAVMIESEIWPATLLALERRGVPLAVVSARLSARSFSGWRRSGAVGRALFSRIALALAQSPADAERLEALGVRRVAVAGNIKVDAAAPDADPAALAAFLDAVDGRPRWLAASTHAGEEVAVAEVHRHVAARVPGLLTVLAPRHPARGNEIRALLQAGGLRVASRSRGEAVDATVDVYLADTIGEMGLFYRAVRVVFVAGSLVPVGGHNPLEAAQLDCAVLAGPLLGSQKAIFRSLEAEGGAQIVADTDALAAAVEHLLTDPAATERAARAAFRVTEAGKGSLARTLDALQPLLADAKRV